jgi:hypothetical protein
VLHDGDVIQRRGFPLTNTLRTVTDLGSGRDLIESVVAIDLALYAGLIGMDTLNSHIEKSAGAKGIRRLRRAVGLADSRSAVSDGDPSPRAARSCASSGTRASGRTARQDGAVSWPSRPLLLGRQARCRVRRAEPRAPHRRRSTKAERPLECRLPRPPIHRHGSSRQGLSCGPGSSCPRSAPPKSALVAAIAPVALRKVTIVATIAGWAGC